jgi:hypothetical protein
VSKIACGIDLFLVFNIEGNMVKARFVDLEGMVGMNGFRLPDVESCTVCRIDIDCQVVMRAVVVLDLTYRVTEELKKGPEKPHRLGEITDGDRDVINRAMKHTSSAASLLTGDKVSTCLFDRWCTVENGAGKGTFVTFRAVLELPTRRKGIVGCFIPERKAALLRSGQ